METRIRKGLAKLMALCLLLMMMPMNVFAATSTVSVGAQVGIITAATTGPGATFVVTTDADNGQAVSIAWFAANGTTPALAPTGVTAAGTAVASGASTITVNAGDTSVVGSYYFKATVETITSALVTVTVTPKQLTITNPTLTLSKVFDGNTTASVTAGALSGVVTSGGVTVSAAATYDTRTVGINKTITVVYTLAGSNAGQYIKPVNYAVTTGEITALQLTIVIPALTLTKAYDGNTTAAVTAGALIGVVAPDAVTASALAYYNTAAVGTNKVITVAFTIAGTNAANYIKPVNYVVTTGATITYVMTALTAAITAEVGTVHTSPVFKLTITDYTTASWTAYTGKIAAAIVVEADANATQAEIDAATAAIGTSKAGLVRAYTLASGVEQNTGGAGHTRIITIGGANAGNLTGKYLVVQFTQGTGNTAKVSVVMISSVSTSVTVSYQVAGTKVEAWLTSGMPDLVAPNMGVIVYASVTTN